MINPLEPAELVAQLRQHSVEHASSSRSIHPRSGDVVRIVTELLLCTGGFSEEERDNLKEIKRNFKKAGEPQRLLNRLITRVDFLTNGGEDAPFLDTLFKTASLTSPSSEESRLKSLFSEYQEYFESDRERVVVLDVLTRSIDQENKLNAIEQRALLAQAAEQKEVPFFEAVVIYVCCGRELGDRVREQISRGEANKSWVVDILYHHFFTLGEVRECLDEIFRRDLHDRFRLEDLLYTRAHLPTIDMGDFLQYVREDGKVLLQEAVRALRFFPEKEREKSFQEATQYRSISAKYGLFNRLRLCAFEPIYYPQLRLFADRDELECALALIEGEGDEPLWMGNPSIKEVWGICKDEKAELPFVKRLERRMRVYAPNPYYLADVGSYLNGPTETLLSLLKATTSLIKSQGTKERQRRVFALIGELFSRQGVTPQDLEGMFDWPDIQRENIPKRLLNLANLLLSRAEECSTWESKEAFFDVISAALERHISEQAASFLREIGVERFRDERDIVHALEALTMLDKMIVENVESVAATYALPLGLAMVLCASCDQDPLFRYLSPSDQEEVYRFTLLLRTIGKPKNTVIYLFNGCESPLPFPPSLGLAVQMRLPRYSYKGALFKMVKGDAAAIEEAVHSLDLIPDSFCKGLADWLEDPQAEQYGAFNLFRAHYLNPKMRAEESFSSEEELKKALDIVYHALRLGVKEWECKRIWTTCVSKKVSILPRIEEETKAAIASLSPLPSPRASQESPYDAPQTQQARQAPSLAVRALQDLISP